ncbi:MAG: SCO family protein [Xanthomonadales bacterium]|nr:SCO family protein [Xanthomonadales bacterium]
MSSRPPGRDIRPAPRGHGWLRRVLPAVSFSVLAACSDSASEPNLEHMVALDPPRDVAAFELTDQHGRPFTAADLRDRWTVLFVGFTHCPDICPTTLGLLASVEKKMANLRRPVQFVFVSADPERDTPSRLRDYVSLFNAEWTALGGPFDQLDRLLDSLQLAYVKVPTGNGDYTIDHSTALVLIDPEARMVGFYPAPHEPAELVADLESL